LPYQQDFDIFGILQKVPSLVFSKAGTALIRAPLMECKLFVLIGKKRISSN